MQEPPYILRMNIERYQSMLQDATIVGDQRRTIETLLAEARAQLATTGAETGRDR
ncbi:MAG: hypothetical protein L6R19_17105 [Alphaproteobacteria bacterium]|nr:hypothetical protein [Alphaproteobacteria bacterium]